MQKGNMEQTNEKLACKGETQLNEIVSIKLQIIFGSMWINPTRLIFPLSFLNTFSSVLYLLLDVLIVSVLLSPANSKYFIYISFLRVNFYVINEWMLCFLMLRNKNGLKL
jgi:hypothetical protein